jgi:hypothetical protein
MKERIRTGKLLNKKLSASNNESLEETETLRDRKFKTVMKKVLDENEEALKRLADK